MRFDLIFAHHCSGLNIRKNVPNAGIIRSDLRVRPKSTSADLRGGQSGHGPPMCSVNGTCPPPAVTDFTWANYNNIGLLHSLHSATCSRDDRGKIILDNKHSLGESCPKWNVVLIGTLPV